MQRILYVQEISKVAAEALRTTNTWSVSHIFENGFNLANALYPLVFVSKSGGALCPFGLSVGGADFKVLRDVVKQGEHFVESGSKELCYGAEIKLNWSRARERDLMQREITMQEEILSWYISVLHDVADSHQQQCGGRMTGQTGLPELIKLPELTEGLVGQSPNPTEAPTILSKLIGRGAGLTPSGDDFLIGLLWVNAIHPFLSGDIIDTMKELVYGKEQLTTRVSLNYYYCAFGGQFSEGLNKLAAELKEGNRDEILECTKQILQMGSTSGRDTLQGVLLGMHLIKNC